MVAAPTDAKGRTRWREGRDSYLEPDEAVIYVIAGVVLPFWFAVFVVPFGPFGLLLTARWQTRSTAVATDRNVYVFEGIRSRDPFGVRFKAPLGTCEASMGGSGFPGRYLLIGDQKIWLNNRRKIMDAAAAIVAAATEGPGAIQPAIAQLREPTEASPNSP